jgi:hypothetical protein
VAASATLERRLANFRATLARVEQGPGDGRAEPARRRARTDHAERLAAAIDGEVIRSALGTFVRLEHPATAVPVDRARLASLPGQPPAGTPLVCLDTETTGLGTATGTYAFLVGLGWWEGDRFVQVQLLLPDQPDEIALLEEIARLIPADGWLVTYNGRGFDWPLLVTRFRMARRAAPAHAGHLDLLPLVRRLFRHRMNDARLKTVEEDLLDVRRHADVEGWEIPARYLDFLRGGPATPLLEVIRHNAEDVRSLARLLAHVETRFGDPDARRGAPAGDLAGLAAAYGAGRRHGEALACLDAALEAPARHTPPLGVPQRRTWTAILTTRADDPLGSYERGDPTWAERPPSARRPVVRERLLLDRARLLRRVGRVDEAFETWRDLAAAGGAPAIVAWIEVAKHLEHRRRDSAGALDATQRARALVERQRMVGRPLPRLETDLAVRAHRLRRRLARSRARSERRDGVVAQA